jgi:hypothetical protein
MEVLREFVRRVVCESTVNWPPAPIQSIEEFPRRNDLSFKAEEFVVALLALRGPLTQGEISEAFYMYWGSGAAMTLSKMFAAPLRGHTPDDADALWWCPAKKRGAHVELTHAGKKLSAMVLQKAAAARVSPPVEEPGFHTFRDRRSYVAVVDADGFTVPEFAGFEHNPRVQLTALQPAKLKRGSRITSKSAPDRNFGFVNVVERPEFTDSWLHGADDEDPGRHHSTLYGVVMDDGELFAFKSYDDFARTFVASDVKGDIAARAQQRLVYYDWLEEVGYITRKITARDRKELQRLASSDL